MDEALKNKIEAVLFSIGKKINIEEILRMTKEKDKGRVVACLIELKKKYNENENNSLMVLQDGDYWKLTIKDQYIDVAKEMGIETELSKTVMETLAVIAYKNPVLQSEVIKTRTNKAYDHLKALEELGYIQREKYGRTKKLKLTQKFFDYFDLPPDSLREKFGNVEEMEKVIENREYQIHNIIEKKKEMLNEQKRDEVEMEKHNIFMESKESDVKEILEHDGHGMDVIKGEKYGELEVIDEPNDGNEESDDEKKSDTEKQKELEEKEMLGETGEKVGELDVYQEPDNYIEPGIDNIGEEERKPSFIEDDEEFDEANMESVEGKNKEKEEDIERIQELKDKLNESEVEEDKDVEESDEDNNVKEIIDNENNEVDEEKKEIVEDKEKESDEDNNVKEIIDNKNNEVEEEKKEIVEEHNNDKEEREEHVEEKIIEKEKIIEEVEKEDNQEKEYLFKDNDIDYGESKEKKVKEDSFFDMEGIPKNIMEKIEEKAKRIMGEDGKEIREDSE